MEFREWLAVSRTINPIRRSVVLECIPLLLGNRAQVLDEDFDRKALDEIHAKVRSGSAVKVYNRVSRVAYILESRDDPLLSYDFGFFPKKSEEHPRNWHGFVLYAAGYSEPFINIRPSLHFGETSRDLLQKYLTEKGLLNL